MQKLSLWLSKHKSDNGYVSEEFWAYLLCSVYDLKNYYITFYGGNNLLSRDKQSNSYRIEEYFKSAGYKILDKIILPRRYGPRSRHFGYNHRSKICALILYKGDENEK